MTITAARIYQTPAAGLPATDTTLYTASGAVIIKQIIVANSNTVDVACFLSVVPSGGSLGNGNKIIPGTMIGAGQTAILDLTVPLATGDFISAKAGVASQLGVTITGGVIT